MIEERRKVLVSLNGNYSAADQGDDKIEVVFPGTFARQGETRYIRFDEPGEEPGEEPVRTMIRYTEQSAEVVRSGAIKTRMIFEPGKKSECRYDTVMGQLRLGVFTSALELSEEKGQIDLSIRYTLDDGSGRCVDCRIELKVREKVSVDEGR